jgi:hypothetical protein
MLIGTVEWVAEIGLLRGDGDVAKYEATVLQVMNQALLPLEDVVVEEPALPLV